MRRRGIPRRPFAVALAACAWLLCAAAPAAARGQQERPLASVLPDLVLREIVLLRGAAGPPHQAHFSPLTNEPQNPVVGIVQGFNTQVATQFSTFPLGSSTGGLTYVFDESVGTFRRGSASFGPLFAERALTIGRRRLSAGFNYQHTPYHTFAGQPLDDGSIRFYLRHQDCCGFTDPANLIGFMTVPSGSRLNPPFEGDIIEAALSLEASTHTTAVFMNYGVTDRWDVGVAIPFVRVKLDAQVEARIIRLVTDSAPDVHTFEIGNPGATRVVRHAGDATGLGDVVLRTKYHAARAAGGGLAVAFDLRLPTGDEQNLLGAGGTQGRLQVVLSGERGRLGHHVNVGYTLAAGDVPGTPSSLAAARVPDELNYTAGVEFVAGPRLTLMGDVVGRTLRGAGRLDLVSKGFEYNDPTLFTMDLPGPGCGGFVGGFTCRTAFFDEFAPRAGHLTLLLGAAGVKYNLAGNLLVSGSVLFPLNTAGLRSRLTTVVGIDYAF